MGFHSILAYFTGYKYEPDPEVTQQPPEQNAGRPLHPDMTSIVETIVREKAEQEPEDQAATAEGDVTFSDLMQQYEESDATAQPPPLPSVLDGPGSFESPGSLFDTPQDRLVQDGSGLDEGEDAAETDQADQTETDQGGQDADTESDAWLSEMGLLGQGDMPLERSLQSQPDGTDRLGLDDMFGQGDEAATPETDADGAGGMFGGEPGYEDLVGEVLESDENQDLGGMDSGNMDEDEPKLIEHMDDLLPVNEEDIVPTDSGDHGFAKSVLLADERMAESAARKVLASDVTININVGEVEDGDEGLEGLEDAGEEISEGLEGAADELGEKLEGAADELGGDEGEFDLDEENPDDDLSEEDDELDLGGKDELDLGLEAESILRRVLANDVTININIKDGEGVDLEVPEDLLGEDSKFSGDIDFGEEPDEDFGEEPDEDFGEESDEGLGEELDGQGLEMGPTPKKGDGESFDELDDLDIFQSGDKNDDINEFGI